ncbi:hypothetical protein A9Q81_10885 [Gammaproteobacteria bacterium 42_54_T18]|nr:hypothetical protein A9Q81_10885 [Gammaproteobacteria bacterium 42_54_T18]
MNGINIIFTALTGHLKWLLFLSVFSLLSACGGAPDSDTQAPVITFNGEADIAAIQGRDYTDPVTATDNVDGAVAVTITGEIDTSTLGNYEVTYTATDAAGNQATVTRNITVREALPFITTWKTDNYGASEDNQTTISTTTSNQNYTVDWGDGSQDAGVAGEITHTYASAGIYTVSISGVFKNIAFATPFGPETDSQKLLTIEQWGDTQWSTMQSAFRGAINLVLNASDVPDLSNVTDMSDMFFNAINFNGDISGWDVTSVTDMSSMFGGASVFNSDISQWDVSSVTDMGAMFGSASAFNGDISGWDVSAVTDMSWMFYGTSVFNGDISGWDVSSVTEMSYMFYEASAFNGDVGGWDVSSVTSMSWMFYRASVFNGDISGWDVSSVTNMSWMFDSAYAFNRDISGWDVSSVTDMASMFYYVTLSTQNYDALLQGWSSKVLQPSVYFSGGNSQYSSAAQAARDALVNTYGWNVTDGGLEAQ